MIMTTGIDIAVDILTMTVAGLIIIVAVADLTEITTTIHGIKQRGN